MLFIMGAGAVMVVSDGACWRPGLDAGVVASIRDVGVGSI